VSESITLCGIGYRVTMADKWTVVFTEKVGVAFRPMRFIMHRDKLTLWQFQPPSDGWIDVPARHIVQAYEWCKARVGGDFDAEPLAPSEIVPHQWQFDEKRRMTYCAACEQDMHDQIMFRSCLAK
jgi:hypothetical protein